MKAKCALVQMQFRRDREENVRRGAEFVREAGREGARIICLPELATSIYPAYVEEPAYREWAEPVPGPATEVMARAAADAGAYVIFPLYERTEDGHLFNTAVVIDPGGEVVGRYRKNSIPDVRMAVMMGMEKFYFEPGDLGYPVFETDLGIKVGITICYERHLPEGPRSLALGGADVVFVPTATGAGRELWDVELRAHAIANLFWVGGVNRVGRDEDGSSADFYGSSFFSAPNGEVVAAAGDEGEAIVYAEIDTERSRQLREDWGFFRDRRPELYGAIAD
ncbi:MAG TPA: nitrilase-related carbon-nitrogen hydrolase [Solirubrobacterales bacterium]|nr:nitrilase-related carbon-nitrogen hydrolase [Solirubrobacterales bacterium]